MLAKINTDEKGGIISEFAIITPFILVLFLAVLTVGFTLYSQYVLNSAAREIARYSAIHGIEDTTGIEEIADDYFGLVLPSMGITPTVGENVHVELGGDEDNMVYTHVEYSYAPVIGFRELRNIIGAGGGEDSFTLEATSGYRREYPKEADN